MKRQILQKDWATKFGNSKIMANISHEIRVAEV